MVTGKSCAVVYNTVEGVTGCHIPPRWLHFFPYPDHQPETDPDRARGHVEARTFVPAGLKDDRPQPGGTFKRTPCRYSLPASTQAAFLLASDPVSFIFGGHSHGRRSRRRWGGQFDPPTHSS